VYLGRKGGDFLLPKITRALTQFVPALAPSATPSATASQDQPGRKGGFRRFKGQEGSPPEAQEAAPSPPASGELVALRRPAGPDARQLSVAHAFVHFLKTFQDQRALLQKWLGTRAYRALSASSRKGPRLRKGTIIDRDAA
jgi:hypothetical protein